MDMPVQVQILNEAVYISYRANILRESMIPTILSSFMAN